MYSGGKCTCGKRRESEIACTAAGIIPAEREGRAKTHVTLRELYVRKLPGAGKSMYHCGNCTCGKRRESETACNIVRELYVRKLPGAGKRMYRCRECTCGKRRESETACNIAGTVRAETAGSGKAHVQIQRVYLQKRWSGRMGMYVAQEWKFVRGRRSGN